ncbi:MAG TPA: hypothetical protein VIK84_07335 [Haloplasmataceae bacterium]
MEEKQRISFINIIKLPFVFILYFLYIILSIFIPSKYVNKVIKIGIIEENINYYFTSPFYLKIIALIITVVIYIYFE